MFETKADFRMARATMPRSPLLRLTLPAILLLCIWFLHPRISGNTLTVKIPHQNAPNAHPPLQENQFVRELLANHSIGPDITFASRKLQYVMDSPERLQNTEINLPLFSQPFGNVSIDKEELRLSSDVLKIHVTPSRRPNQIDASKILFAASTTPERFNNKRFSPLKEWVSWLTDAHGNSNGAFMLLALSEGNDTQIAQTQQTLTNLGINATVIHARKKLDMASRYVDLLRMIWEQPSRPERSYFALVDDDTFFPAINSLLTTLSTYNPNKPYYIGTFTERADWLAKHKLPMAYGGAGIFLTAPLISTLLKHDCLATKPDGTSKVPTDTEGDRFLYRCIKQYTNVALTRLPRLYQFDMFGDPSGFYESGNQPLSLHHYKTWHHLSPSSAHLVANACGEDCVFQKFQFSDNFVLSNGYSVAHYPAGIDFDPLQYEGTFSSQGAGEKEEEVVYAPTFGMLRKPLSRTGKKRQWQLLGAMTGGKGKVTQVYVKRRKDDRWVRKGVEKLPKRDSVVVLTWIP